MPKVSVIIPVYNGAKYLSGAINSVLNQSYQDYEIIVINDGSEDNTKGAVENYIKKYPDRVRYLYQKNRGTASARNLGIKSAKGEYIAFLDQDDLWLKDKLKKQVATLDNNKNIGLVYTSMYISNRGNIERIMPSVSTSNFNDLFLGDGCIPTPSVMLRKECLDKLGMFDEDLRIVDDYDLWLRLLKKYKVMHIKEPLGIYRVHETNMTKKKKLWRKNGIKMYKKLLKDKNMPTKLVRIKLSNEYYDLGKICYEAKEYIEALGAIKNAVTYYPLLGCSFFRPKEKLMGKMVKLIKPYLALIFLVIIMPTSYMKMNSVNCKIN